VVEDLDYDHALEAARRGAEVVAIDLSPTLVALARERLPESLGAGSVHFCSGDMLDPRLGSFDHVVAMDSLIHYRALDVVAALSRLADRTHQSMVFTAAPRTPLTLVMLGMGKLFPRSDRSPAIEPIAPTALNRLMAAEASLIDWRMGRYHNIAAGFYRSQAIEWVRR
ncbi:MAG TPA: methyltransferase domain-containing protein, partial [Rubrivivax sp.]|nr:methyltransferase domain-containing protein [Rubrivivax sp.]